MNIKNHNIFIVLLIALLLLISNACGLTYAYFTNQISTSSTPEYTFTDDSRSTIAITSLEDLYCFTQDTFFNSNDELSNATDRHTILLLNDLILKSDLVITADCHINLGGKVLNLNGYNITIKHNYTGTILINNGYLSSPFESGSSELGTNVIINSSSRLIVNTPNAGVIINNIMPIEGLANAVGSISYDPDFNYLVTDNMNDEIIVNNAFKMISTILSDNYDDNLLFHNIENLNDITYISSCFYNDIDLPTHFYNFNDLVITYSSNSEYLSSSGKVTAPASGYVATATLTANIQYKDINISKDFTIKIINELDKTNWATQGIQFILDYFDYYSLFDENEVFQYYSMLGSIVLPQQNTYFNGTYLYETLNVSNEVMQTSATTNDHFVPISNNNVDTPDHLNYMMTLDSEVRFIRINCTIGDVTITETVSAQGEGSTSIVNNYTYATSIVRQLYGNKIEISPSNNPNNSLNGYTVQELFRDVTPYTAQGVLGISYSLVNNIDATYAVGDISQTTYGLFVSSNRNQDPSVTQSVFVNITFTFSTAPYTVSINLPIYYTEDQSGTNISSFQPYYNYYNTQFINTTNSYTYKNFSIPLTFGSTYPVYYFDIVDSENGIINNEAGQLIIDNNVILTQSLSYTNNNNTITYSYQQFLALNSTIMLQVVTSGNAKWNISINTDYLPLVDTVINLRYRYKMMAESITWGGEGEIDQITGEISGVYLSVLTVPGIVRNEAGRIPDTNLYTQLFNIYHSDETYVANETFIIFSRLSNRVEEIDFSDNADRTTGRIETFEGINYLTGLERINLSNALNSIISQSSTANRVTETQKQISYISQMKNLQYLNLSDNRIMDRASNNYGMPTGSDNGFLEDLSQLLNLTELHLENTNLYVSEGVFDDNNNSIYDFTDLTLFSSLEVVYLYNNIFDCNSYNGILAFLNDIFSDLVNGIYGSTGGTNQAIYAELYGNDILVYFDIDSNNNLISYEPDNGNTYYMNYRNLSNIEYQQTLENGISIESLYQNFSTNPSSYGIQTPDDISGSVTLVYYNHAISYSPILENDDTIYTTNKFSIIYTIRYKYTYLITTDYVDIPISLEFSIIRK